MAEPAETIEHNACASIKHEKEMTEKGPLWEEWKCREEITYLFMYGCGARR